MRVSKLVVPVGGLPHEAERIMSIAANVAEVLDAPLEMVHVVPLLDAGPATERRREWMTPLADSHQATLRLVEHQSVSRALRDVVTDQPDAVICMRVDAAGTALDLVLGSISEDILRAGHHRCVLIGPEVEAESSITAGPVVVCVDGSDHAESILPDAAAWADTAGTAIWVVSVSTDDDVPSDVDGSSYVHRTALGLGVNAPEWEVLHGSHPAQAIIDFANQVGAGSIVMATHGRGGLGRLAMGSTTMRVVNGAPCPVITRRPPALSAVIG